MGERLAALLARVAAAATSMSLRPMLAHAEASFFIADARRECSHPPRPQCLLLCRLGLSVQTEPHAGL